MNRPLSLLRTHDSAVAYVDHQQSVTYATLKEQVLARAEELRSSGVLPGSRIAFCPATDLATLVNFWAIWHCQANACPISPQFPQSRRHEWAQAVGATWIDADQAMRPSAKARPEAGTILLSSGSTGVPKAIVHRLSAHFANAEQAAQRTPLTRGDGWLWSLPAFHVSGLAILIRCALAGATVISGTKESLLSETTLKGLAATHLSVVPTQLRRLLCESWFPHPALKTVLLGGAAIPFELLQSALQRQVPVRTTYGMTETASQIATSTLHETFPQSNIEVLPGWEVQTNADGEIIVRGPGLCDGYERDGQLISALDEAGWYHTGDRGRVHDNKLEVLGRIDQMIISGGENIFPEAIERALMAFDEITQAVVVGRTDVEFGERPVAFLKATHWCPDRWRQKLSQQLRKWEIPQQYFPLPDEAYQGLKPNRVFLSKQAETLFRGDSES